MTQQKELELQLSIQQEVLQRRNQEMEQDSAALQQEKERLESEAAELAMRLDAVMRDKFAHQPSGFDADTPIDKTLNLLHGIIAGQQPQVQAAMDLYHILSESDTPLRQPVALETQLLAEHLDDDVGRSMLQLLQGNHSRRALKEELSRSVSKGSGGNWGLVQGALGGLSSQDVATSYVPQNVTPVIERMLQDAESNWHFDVFGFDEECKGKGLSVLAFHLYKQAGFIRDFKLYEVKLINFLQKAESGYSSANPYHNSIHATSVLQMTHMLLHHGGVLKSRAVSKAQYMSSYWSAITHDYEHGGLNNDFLIKTAHPLAIRYNDQSPLENHHVAAAAGLLSQDEYRFMKFAALKSETIMQVRICCINQVLGTDMKKHFDIISRFEAAFKRPDANSLNRGAVEEALEWDKVKPEDKTLAHQMLVKCADIGHLAAAPRTHKRWATLLEDEFFIQGDKEKAAGLPVSPLMDRSMKGGMTRSQLGFFNIVGIPLFKSFTELFPEAQPMLDGVLDNFKHWELGTAMEDLPP
ncbi:putative 3',5'-cyclic phosphodiesterase pde-3 [Trebouxia sp. C0010 RCD-2024]